MIVLKVLLNLVLCINSLQNRSMIWLIVASKFQNFISGFIVIHITKELVFMQRIIPIMIIYKCFKIYPSDRYSKYNYLCPFTLIKYLQSKHIILCVYISGISWFESFCLYHNALFDQMFIGTELLIFLVLQ